MTDPAKSVAGGETSEVEHLGRLRRLARQRLDREIFDYIDGGAGAEVTRRRNRRDLDAITLLPLAMRDVSAPQTGTSLLGSQLPAPIGISPMALHRLVHPDGEIATALGAHAARVPMIVSAMSSVAVEEVAGQSSHQSLWLQTYVFKDRGFAPALLARAEAAGFKAIVVTVGCPVVGYRDRNALNGFVLPPSASPAHFERTGAHDPNNPIHSFAGAEIDAAATWKDIEALRNKTRLPLLVKGIMNPADVAPALDSGAVGLIVSNHGGRQLDTTASTIATLPAIAEELDRRAALLVDSGFRRGTDLLKALALGADAVLLGRPILWALSLGGSAGVATVLDRFVTELRVSMQLAGCATLAELREQATTLLPVAGRRL